MTAETPPTDIEPAISFHYYDRHPTLEDLMGESVAQDWLLNYLIDLLQRHYRDEPVFVARNLNIYTARVAKQYPVAPDLALFRDVSIPRARLRRLRSWRMYEPDRPPPQLVLEVASDSTWPNDLNDKPTRYGELGVQEYIFYDPNEPQEIPGARLRVWRYPDGRPELVPPDTTGRVWSNALTSWIVPDTAMLRLIDGDGKRWSSTAEAERVARLAAQRARRETQLARREAEAAREDQAVERTAKEAERAAKEAAWERLRQLGVDPETL